MLGEHPICKICLVNLYSEFKAQALPFLEGSNNERETIIYTQRKLYHVSIQQSLEMEITFHF